MNDCKFIHACVNAREPERPRELPSFSSVSFHLSGAAQLYLFPSPPLFPSLPISSSFSLTRSERVPIGDQRSVQQRSCGDPLSTALRTASPCAAPQLARPRAPSSCAPAPFRARRAPPPSLRARESLKSSSATPAAPYGVRLRVCVFPESSRLRAPASRTLLTSFRARSFARMHPPLHKHKHPHCVKARPDATLDGPAEIRGCDPMRDARRCATPGCSDRVRG